jgi:hypothetical protein
VIKIEAYKVVYGPGAFKRRLGRAPSFSELLAAINFYQTEYDTYGGHDLDADHPIVHVVQANLNNVKDAPMITLLVMLPEGLENSQDVLLRTLDEFEEFMEIELGSRVDQTTRSIE